MTFDYRCSFVTQKNFRKNTGFILFHQVLLKLNVAFYYASLSARFGEFQEGASQRSFLRGSLIHELDYLYIIHNIISLIFSGILDFINFSEFDGLRLKLMLMNNSTKDMTSSVHKNL